jgi:hypothetical protein
MACFLILSLPDPLIKSEDMLDRAIQRKEMDSPVKPENDSIESDFMSCALGAGFLTIRMR